VHAVGFFDTIDRADVGMTQRGQQLGLALEARDVIGIVRRELGEDLQRDAAIQSWIARPIDLAHATGAQWRDDVIGPESAAGGERHLVEVLDGLF